jgi:hypothetical protein
VTSPRETKRPSGVGAGLTLAVRLDFETVDGRRSTIMGIVRPTWKHSRE